MFVKKGDQVVVLSGDDRGKRGKVLRAFPDEGKILVEGINYVWKHLRKSKKNPQGGRLQKESPIRVCKVRVIDPSSDKPTRAVWRVVDGRRVRWSKAAQKPFPGETKKR